MAQVVLQLEHGPLAGKPDQLLDKDVRRCAASAAVGWEVQGRDSAHQSGCPATPRPAAPPRPAARRPRASSACQAWRRARSPGWVTGGEARRPLQLCDDRMERAVCVVCRAEMVGLRCAARPTAPSRRARSSRDLPMPASPAIRTTWPSPSLTQFQRSRSMASSCSRPISGVTRCPCGGPRSGHRRSLRPQPGSRRQALGSP